MELYFFHPVFGRRLFMLLAATFTLAAPISPRMAWASGLCEQSLIQGPSTAGKKTALQRAQERTIAESTTDLIRETYGDTVSILEKTIQKAIVAFDFHLANQGLDEAMRITLELNPRSKDPRSLPAVSIRSIWEQVERAQLQMTTSELHVQYLDWLAEQFPNKRDAISALKNEEQEVILDQSQIFGRYFKAYYRLRQHLEAISSSKDCEGSVCQSTAQTFNLFVGAKNEPALAKMSDEEFKAKIEALGLPRAAKTPEYFDQVFGVSLPANLYERQWEAGIEQNLPQKDPEIFQYPRNLSLESSYKDDEGGLESLPRSFNVSARSAPRPQVSEPPIFDGKDRLEIIQLMERSKDPEIQTAIVEAEKRAQRRPILKKVFGNVLTMQFIFKSLEAINPVLAKTIRGSGLFSKVKAMDLNERYGYGVTQIYRNGKLKIGEKIMRLKALNDLGSEAGLDVFEFIARRSDLLYFWHDIYHEMVIASDPANSQYNRNLAFYYKDLLPRVKKLETQRGAGELKPLAAIYAPSWIDYAARTAILTLTAGFGMYAAYHGGPAVWQYFAR